jgi:hypothetical protein
MRGAIAMNSELNDLKIDPEDLLRDAKVQDAFRELRGVMDSAHEIVHYDNLERVLSEAYHHLLYVIEDFEKRVFKARIKEEFPLPIEKMIALGAWLADKDCDATLHHTMTFIRENDLTAEQKLHLEAYLRPYRFSGDRQVLAILRYVLPEHVLPESEDESEDYVPF